MSVAEIYSYAHYKHVGGSGGGEDPPGERAKPGGERSELVAGDGCPTGCYFDL